MIKWALFKDFSNRLYNLTAVLLPPQTLVVNIYLDIFYFYVLYYGFGKYYFKTFLSYERCRLVRITSKVVMLLYPVVSCYVVSIIHRKFCRQSESSKRVIWSILQLRYLNYTWFDGNCISCYKIHFKHQRCNIS